LHDLKRRQGVAACAGRNESVGVGR
jgi:hypothetical protein